MTVVVAVAVLMFHPLMMHTLHCGILACRVSSFRCFAAAAAVVSVVGTKRKATDAEVE